MPYIDLTLLVITLLAFGWGLHQWRAHAAVFAALAKRELLYQTLLEQTRDGVLLVNPLSHRVVEINDAAAVMLGFSREELTAQNFGQLQAMVEPDEFEQWLSDVMRDGKHHCESGLRRKDGLICSALMNFKSVSLNGQSLLLITLTDISERLADQEKLRQAASVFASAKEGIIITNLVGCIIDVNEAFCDITGYARDAVIGKKSSMLQSGRQDAEFYRAMWETLTDSGNWRGEIWNRRKSGEIFAELLSISAVKDLTGIVSHYVGVFSDITPIKKHEQQLQRIAHHDVLTGLPNRILLADRMGQAIAFTKRSRKLMAVCCLDLDGFKPINDAYGHQIGDEVLVVIGERLQACLRGTDTLARPTSEGAAGRSMVADTIARVGGDEFVIMLPELPRVEDCEVVLRRILDAIAKPIDVNDLQVTLSASVGVSFYPLDSNDPDILLRYADQAMYQAKQTGKNRYRMFDESRDSAVHAQQTLIRELEQALLRNEFVLHYQPKVNMHLGTILGVEALIRWQHPTRGLLQPGDFLPAIEYSNLIVTIGQWVIKQAMLQATAWREQGVSMVIAVNIAARQLQQDNFVQRLKELMAAHPGAAGLLELEVLETAALDDLSHASQVLAECQAMGVEVALDDFGTGYSSLAYLKRLPAQTIKIDQSFVSDMLNNMQDMVLIEGIVSLAQAFRRTVIAEGVETQEHGTALIGLGCELGQGYGIARPMSADAFLAWHSHWQPPAAWAQKSVLQPQREDLPLLAARTDHLRWVASIAAILRGGEHLLTPPLEIHHCRFGAWYKILGKIRYDHAPEFTAILPVHEAIHQLGKELLELRAQGDPGGAQARLGELFELRDQLLTAIDRLLTVSLEKEGVSENSRI